MSGVAKDDINPSAPSEDTAAAVGEAEPAHAENFDATADAESRASRRAAPHLRVVADNDTDDLVAPAATLEQPPQRIGQLIRATRENLGYALDQVSKETRVHVSHLRAIEEMTPNLLGAPVYAKGYIKAYARHLGLDEQTTLDRYLQECAILKDPEKQTIAPPATGRKLPVALPVFGFLIVALVLGAGAVFLLDGQKPATVAATDTPPPAAEQAAATAPGILAEDSSAPALTQQLRIVAVKPARIEIRSAAGDKMVNREFLPGEPFLVRVGAGWTVSTEDGSAFEWRLGEQSLGLLAPEGPVYSQSVDIAAERPPVIVEPPPHPVTTPDAGETAIEASSVTPPAAAPSPSPPARSSNAAPSRNTNTVATPPQPRATRPAPETATPASPPATQPLAAAPPPSEQTPPPVTPQQDPALLAYPGLPPQPAQ